MFRSINTHISGFDQRDGVDSLAQVIPSLNVQTLRWSHLGESGSTITELVRPHALHTKLMVFSFLLYCSISSPQQAHFIPYNSELRHFKIISREFMIHSCARTPVLRYLLPGVDVEFCSKSQLPCDNETYKSAHSVISWSGYRLTRSLNCWMLFRSSSVDAWPAPLERWFFG